MKTDFIPTMVMAPEGGDGGGGGASGGDAGGGDAGAKADGPMTKVTVNDGTQGGNSGSASTPFAAGDANTGEDGGKVDYKTLMGEYAEDPAFEAFKTDDGFDIQKIAKSYKETKALVGQKLGIPGEDASPEAKAEFYKALGVPEQGTSEAYGLRTEAPENWPEGVTYDTEIGGKFAEKAKELNLTPDQAKGLQEWYDGMTVDMIGEIGQDAGMSEQEFDKVATDMFGDKKDQILQDANVLLQKYVPEDIRADIAKSVPNTVLMAMAAAITGETKHLTGEDRAIGQDAGASGENAQQLRDKARKLMQDPAYNNPFAKGQEEHERLKKEVRGIFQRIDQINQATK